MSAASATPRPEQDPHPIESDAWIADLIRENEELKKEMARVVSKADSSDSPTASTNEVMPSLRWETDEDDSAYVVYLDGMKNHFVMADGATKEEALHRLGDILFGAFNDACTCPEEHRNQASKS